MNYISCVFIGYKNVFGPIAVLVTNRFRLEQKSYLPLKLQFMSGFGKTTTFNGLLGNRPNYKNPTKRVGLVQSRLHHHFIEN